jgi:fatty-acyl-CoA synthase
MPARDHPNLIAALDAGRGVTQQGFTFIVAEGQDELLSWDRLRAEAMNRAAHLRALGLRMGDRLAIVMPDGRDFVPTFLGATWAGIIPVPLPPPLSLGKLDSYRGSLSAVMNKAEPAYLAMSAKLEDALGSTASRVPSLHGVVTAEELRAEAPAAAAREPVDPDANDIAFLQFTSGSTATPRGVEVTHGSLRANAWAIMRDGLQVESGIDSGVSWLPLYHDMGLIGFVLSPVFHQVGVTFIPPLSFVRNATIWLDTLHRTRGTISFAPNFAYALATRRARPEQVAKWDLSRVRVLGCGAEPINPGTLRGFAEKFSACGLRPEALLPSYGLAEATLAVSFGGLGEPLSTDVIDRDAYERDKRARSVLRERLEVSHAVEFVSCGQAFPAHEVGAFDADGSRLSDRHVGELWVRGPSVARGYYKDPEASRETFGGGWLRTGDLGYLVDGAIHVTGRSKDLIIVNGRNYDPQCIEWLADDAPGVRAGSTAAFSVPGAAGEELVVIVESRTAQPEALQETIKQRVNEQLQLVASEVVIARPGSLPKTSSGKVQRAKARQQYLDSMDSLLPSG